MHHWPESTQLSSSVSEKTCEVLFLLGLHPSKLQRVFIVLWSSPNLSIVFSGPNQLFLYLFSVGGEVFICLSAYLGSYQNFIFAHLYFFIIIFTHWQVGEQQSDIHTNVDFSYSTWSFWQNNITCNSHHPCLCQRYSLTLYLVQDTIAPSPILFSIILYF
jgi:hypothetical protein